MIERRKSKKTTKEMDRWYQWTCEKHECKHDKRRIVYKTDRETGT